MPVRSRGAIPTNDEMAHAKTKRHESGAVSSYLAERVSANKQSNAIRNLPTSHIKNN